MKTLRTFTIAAIAFLGLLISGYSGAQTLKCTTWNLEWFPNGSAKQRPAAQQEQRIKEAADVLRPIDPDIILLQEVRDYDSCARLGEAIAPGVYHVAICSAFKEPFQRGLGKQQVAILSKYQAQAAWAEPWKSMNGVDPPRGLAFAWFIIGNENIGVYSVHLKSNLITLGDTATETAKNIQKREFAVNQLIAHVHDVIKITKLAIKGIVIGGDFNTNHDQDMFAEEKTLDSLIGAGYQNGFEDLPLSQRVTHPANHGYPDATFDYLFTRDLKASQPIVTQTTASDHRPVTRNFSLRFHLPASIERKAADLSQIQIVSTVIQHGIAHIRIRNNNPYPIRGISVTVNYYRFLKKGESPNPGAPPEHTHSHFVESLIMPGQEFEIETFDSRVPQLLAPHNSGTSNEWIAVPTFEHADRLDASP